MDVDNLEQLFIHAEDKDHLMDIYKGVEFLIQQLLRLQARCLARLEAQMKMEELYRYFSSIGSCGWTETELDQTAWQEAILNDPDLYAIQNHFNKAREIFEKAQEPYLIKRFHIQ